MVKHYQVPFIFLMSLFLSSHTFAKSLSLYEEPKKDAKIVSTVDPDKGIVPIFSPKNSEWTKIADPSNGNVGWVKSSDINNMRTTFHVTSSGDGSQSYQIIQYGNMKPYSEEELKKIRERNEAMQKDMQKMVDHMFAEFHHPWMNFPMILPVVVIPEKTATPTTPNTTSTTKK